MHRYSAQGHGAMVSDRVRVEAYARAIRQQVRPGSVVLELGTGTGLFAILAARQGARRVYAIECDDIIEAARRNATANGCGDTIEFIHALSTRAELPERADVIVSDMRGVVPYHERHLEAIVDARARFLAPGGRLIPAQDRLWVACIEAEELHRGMTGPWSPDVCGADLAAARELVLNGWERMQARPEQLVSAAVHCGTLDYLSVAPDHFRLAVHASLVANRPGMAHGLCLWFDSTLAEGVELSNAPEAPPLVYGQAFLPWPHGVAVADGTTIAVAIDARLVGDDYVWTWKARVRDAGSGADLRFEQSTFLGMPLSSDTLRRRAASYVARVDDDARIDRVALGLMEEGHALGAIGHELLARFPARFARWEDALAHAGELSIRYGR